MADQMNITLGDNDQSQGKALAVFGCMVREGEKGSLPACVPSCVPGWLAAKPYALLGVIVYVALCVLGYVCSLLQAGMHARAPLFASHTPYPQPRPAVPPSLPFSSSSSVAVVKQKN